MLLLFRISITIVILAIFYVFPEVIMHPAWRMVIITMKQSCMSKLIVLESVVRRSDSAIYWIVIFSTFVKLAVDQYNFIFRFGIHTFLRSIVGSSSVVSHLFGLFYVGSIFRCLVGSLSGLRTTGP